jgi:hypothetical protein
MPRRRREQSEQVVFLPEFSLYDPVGVLFDDLIFNTLHLVRLAECAPESPVVSDRGLPPQG